MDLIIKSLVEAGYFRARISTLSDFDKVIGGMAWAMQVFSQEIDINIFYKDTLDLGQKIALTERIVMVLLVMNCPHKIEPHQIVGLDHINLLPVIKWLIKRSSEIRREHEAFNRLLALRHYHRVTGTLINRAQWCRVLHIDRLRDLSEKKAQSESITSNEAERVDEAESEFVNRLKSDFKGSQLVSFVSSQPAFLSTANDNRDTQADNTENNALDDELSDDSVDRTDSVHERRDGDELGENVDQHAKTDEHESIAEECQESPELIALHKELDTELLATNQKILTLLKKVDSMPTDLEIIQYQRRYIELHQELISKNKDLKKIYALFNSLDSVKHYLSKEMNLLGSIMSNLELTNDNPNNRYEFLKQFQEIITKIQAVKSEVTGRLETMRNRCDLLNEEYTRLRDSYDGDF